MTLKIYPRACCGDDESSCKASGARILVPKAVTGVHVTTSTAVVFRVKLNLEDTRIVRGSGPVRL